MEVVSLVGFYVGNRISLLTELRLDMHRMSDIDQESPTAHQQLIVFPPQVLQPSTPCTTETIKLTS